MEAVFAGRVQGFSDRLYSSPIIYIISLLVHLIILTVLIMGFIKRCE